MNLLVAILSPSQAAVLPPESGPDSELHGRSNKNDWGDIAREVIRQRPRNTNPQVIKVLRLVAKTKGTVPCVSTEAAQRCYTEITAIAGADDCLGLLQSYHGRALCAQHINDSDGALRWSEQAALVALERRDTR